ncbi:gamma-glutamyl-gamma-aminobutyrate hydrolase family protein [bacterium]|nr:gamma-glutamyl-gamma-aminobutyrate hydrolase family protein [bacterium]MBU1985286.1 gamma-glutamyl-gamma-aminobutyrate hydrolase family protein [bacterium]
MSATTTRRVPIIGVTAAWADTSRASSLSRSGDILYGESGYLKHIENAGGAPLLLSFLRDDSAIQSAVRTLAGLLLTGGEDVHPRRYGQELLYESCIISELRDEFEFRFVPEFLRTGKPVLAICRGLQLVNVVLGGTLIQDLPAQTGIVHHAQQAPFNRAVHSVQLREDSRLARSLKSTIVSVNSTHHQAAERVGESLREVGRSEEGVIEALEHESHPYLVAVQWHPERFGVEQNSHHLLFEDFVRACSEMEASASG